MPEYIALKTFRSADYGQLHRGMTYTLPEQYGKQLMSNGLVRIKAIQKAPNNAAFEGAPRTLGEDTAAPRDAGLGKLSSASLPGHRSRKRTVPTSNTGPGSPILPRK